MHRDAQAGFTLIEALVALSVLAVTATIMLSATESHSRNTIALTDRMIAHWVAQNRLVRLESGARNLPEIVGMAGGRWQVKTKISETTDSDLVRADVAVALDNDPSSVLAELTGFLENAELRP